MNYNNSVRNLPPDKMADIRRMFEKKSESATTPIPTPRPVSKFEVKDGKSDFAATPSPLKPKRKADKSPLRPPPRPHGSPVRQKDVSPNRRTAGAVLTPKVPLTPKPMPRPSVERKSDNESPGLACLPVGKLGQVAGIVAMSGDTDSSNRVSRLIGQLEHKVPSVDKDDGDSQPQTKEKLHNQSVERSESESSETHVYERPWADWTPKEEQLPASVPDKNNESRPVSVFDRLKMFDNISQPSHSPSPGKPTKPPPPLKKISRQRSNEFEGQTVTDAVASPSPQNPTPTKVRPPRPPFRQRSLTEKTKDTNSEDTNKHDTNEPKVDKTNMPDTNQTTINAIQNSSVVKKKPLMPPSKPPRTGAHDDYVKVKKEKEKALEFEREKVVESKTVFKSKQDEDIVEGDFIVVPKGKPDIRTDRAKSAKGLSERKLMKPKRPPPPRWKQQRPFSIATDQDIESLESNEKFSSDSDDLESGDHSFYESLEETPRSHDRLQDPIKHWDLPRWSHPEPIRRSLSDDCIPKAVDDSGNVVYFEPRKLLTQDSTGYDIYLDSEGYAVPSRLVKKKHVTTEEEESETEPSRPIGDRVKSKFKKFKNLFSETDKSPSFDPKSPNQGSTKRKLTIIRKKVEQVFEGLQGSRRKKRKDSVTENNENETDNLDNIQEDADSRVDEQEIRKRVAYSRSVRLKTSASIKESQKYTEKVYPQLFEYAVIVSLRQGAGGVYEPYVIYKFPEIVTLQRQYKPCGQLDHTSTLTLESNVSVPQFCFPDAANFKPSSSSMKSQSYLFVLTNIDGGRVYGYCRRLIPSKSNKVPEVICIISPVDAFYMYNTLLEEIEAKRLMSLDLAQELIAAAFGRPLPSPGKESVIRTLDLQGEMETIFLTRETDSRIENVNCECLLTALGSDKVLKVFASILLERSVLFCAKHLGILSSTIHALSSLLYPFAWQHTFIPVLPSAMLDVICSPTPYIIGITSNHLPKALTLPLDENVLIVDLDKKSFVRSQGDEGTLLPRKIEKALKTVLNMCRIDTDARSNPNLMISEAFLLFFVETVGHYGQHIHTQVGGKKTFKKEDFIKGASSSSLEQLLEWFCETQMFEVFMTKEFEKIGVCNTLELFESRIQEHRQSKTSRLKWKRNVNAIKR